MANSSKTESELRIILVGITGAGKSATGNTILGERLFKSEASPESVTQVCVKHSRKNGNMDVCVIDTPGICGSMTENELKKQIQDSVNLSVPGPHVFLLVISLGTRFTVEEKNAVKWIEENFGKDALKYTIILFTYADQLKNNSLDHFINKSKDLEELVKSCGRRYHAFNNDDEGNHDQVIELLKKVDDMVQINGDEHYTNEMFRDAQWWLTAKTVGKVAVAGTGVVAGLMTQNPRIIASAVASAGISYLIGQQGSPDLKIVLLGKTGSGKSATGNTILGREVFDEKASPVSVTTQCQHQIHSRGDKSVLVIDTPGLCDTSLTEEQLKSELGKCFNIHALVPCVFLLVISLVRRFSEEEKRVVKWIEENFVDASNFTIVLFTHADQLKGKRLDDYIKESKELNNLVNRCKGFHSFNNEERENNTQVTKLLEKIDQIIKSNTNHHYTKETYIMVQEEKEERKRKEEKKAVSIPVRMFFTIVNVALALLSLWTLVTEIVECVNTGTVSYILILFSLCFFSLMCLYLFKKKRKGL